MTSLLAEEVHASDVHPAGILPVAAVHHVVIPVLVVPLLVFPLFLWHLLVFLEFFERKDLSGEHSVLKVFGLLISDTSNHQEAEGIFTIGPALVPAAHFISDSELILGSSGWIVAPVPTFFLGRGISCVGLSNPFEICVAVPAILPLASLGGNEGND